MSQQVVCCPLLDNSVTDLLEMWLSKQKLEEFVHVFITDLFFLSSTNILSFLFSIPMASHTFTVQYSISVPSFPNVRAHNSPQEQDEEQ